MDRQAVRLSFGKDNVFGINEGIDVVQGRKRVLFLDHRFVHCTIFAVYDLAIEHIGKNDSRIDPSRVGSSNRKPVCRFEYLERVNRRRADASISEKLIEAGRLLLIFRRNRTGFLMGLWGGGAGGRSRLLPIIMLSTYPHWPR